MGFNEIYLMVIQCANICLHDGYQLLLPEKVECNKHCSSQNSPHYDSSQS